MAAILAEQDPLWPESPTTVAADGRPGMSTSFTDNMALPIHRWFRYSAGFSAEWAEREIRSRAATRVLDPFAGSGTTLLAAQDAGAESMGIDVHPFVSAVAQGKLLWASDVDEFCRRAKAVIDKATEGDTPSDVYADLLQKCYPRPTLDALMRLRRAVVKQQAGDSVDALLWVALVAILRRCSPVGTANWQYVLPNKTKARVVEPRAAFVEQVRVMAEDMRGRQQRLPAPPLARYIQADVRSNDDVPDQWADLVLTSPPYANNFDYADATRLEMTFLGDVETWGDLKPLRDQLIHSCSQQMSRYPAEDVLNSAPELEAIRDDLRPVYAALADARDQKAGKKAYHAMVVGYFHDMAVAWQQIRRMTAPDGAACFVVGDSAPYGVYVPVDQWLGRLAVAAGFGSYRFEKVRDRNVKWENRKHRVPLHEGRLWVEP